MVVSNGTERRHLHVVGDGEAIAADGAECWAEAQQTGNFLPLMTDGQRGLELGHAAVRELGNDITPEDVLQLFGIDTSKPDETLAPDGDFSGVIVGIQAAIDEAKEGIRL